MTSRRTTSRSKPLSRPSATHPTVQPPARASTIPPEAAEKTVGQELPSGSCSPARGPDAPALGRPRRTTSPGMAVARSDAALRPAAGPPRVTPVAMPVARPPTGKAADPGQQRPRVAPSTQTPVPSGPRAGYPERRTARSVARPRRPTAASRPRPRNDRGGK